MEPLSIGIDFGARDLRVAFAVERAGVVSVEHGPAPPASWLLCERSDSRLGMTFPSVKSRLGRPDGARGGKKDPAEVLTKALARARRSVEEQTGRPVTRATACVPARYPTQPRAAFVEAAHAAGFTEVDLITDSVGAVLAHTAFWPSPATVLVFGAGYEGVECGLVRAVKGHLRVLGYETAATAGAALDELVLDGWAQILRPFVSRARWSAAEWTQIRAAAEGVKEELSRADQAVFPLGVSDGSRLAPPVAFARHDFDEAVEQLFRPVVGLLQPLLGNADMAPDDVDAVVLVGGTTRIPALRASLLAAVGREPVVASPGALAFGAALHASGLGSRLGEAVFALDAQTESAEARQRDRAGAVLRGTTVTGPARATGADGQATLATAGGPAAVPTPDGLRKLVTALVEAGDVDRARTELKELIVQAQAALDGLPPEPGDAGPSPTSPVYRSRLALANARASLEQRRFARAVSESHHAWKRLPDDPEVLDQMIDIHCAAAMANGAFDQYEDSIRWLMCAFSHDESNVRTRALLAARHYTHAQDLHSRGRGPEALEAAEQCLVWDPEHAGAAELHRSLTPG